MSQRIALLIHALNSGGAERLMAQLAARWSEKHEVHLITWSAVNTDTYAIPATVHRHGLDLQRTSASPWAGVVANLKRVSKLRKKLQEIDPQFILSFADQMNIVSLQATRHLKTPHWISEHSDPSQQNLGRMWEAWRQHVYPTCTGCVVLTEEIAGTLSQLVPSDRLRIIPPAIAALPDPAHHSSHAPNADSTRPLTKRVLYVGRLSPEKRVDRLIGAWKSIHHQTPEWELVIVGDGPLRGQLEKQAEDCRVQFAGWQSNPAPFFQQAEVFALASDYEGFPVALLEAMSYGLPCVSTPCSAAIETLNQPETAVLTADGQKELSKTLFHLMDNSRQRMQLGRAARKSAEHYTWPIVGPAWDKLLDAPLGSPGS